jgi:hypothetical protein
MDSLLEFGSEITDVQEDLVRLNLRIRSMIESFSEPKNYGDMEMLNGDIRGQIDLMRKGVEKLRFLAKKQRNVESATMLNTDANSHEDQMTSCYTVGS